MAQNARAARCEQDLRKLRDLAARSQGRIEVLRVAGSPPQEVELMLHFRTVRSGSYPADVQPVTRVVVQLSGRYPLEAPVAVIQTPIFHPNVFTGGRICLGSVWQPSENLELLAQRIVRIVTFDADSINVDSPANPAAADWYRRTIRTQPSAFPTDRWAGPGAPPERPSIRWTPLETGPSGRGSTTLFICPEPGCRTTLRVPAGTTRARCGRCQRIIEVPG
jgi:LSD1 subclass zinc finger protein